MAVKGNVPIWVVDPEIIPVEALSRMPIGSIPEEMDHK
jgi:hypothetical protein